MRWVAFAAVVGVFLAKCLVEMALALLLQWDLLLRPRELVSLRAQQVVRPAELATMRSWGVILAPSDGGSNEPSKTNAFDESILLSSKINHLLPCLAVFFSGVNEATSFSLSRAVSAVSWQIRPRKSCRCRR